MKKQGTTGRRGFLKAAALGGALPAAPGEPSSLKETRYADRTDSVEEKTRLLVDAVRKRDYRLARALTASVKETLLFEEQENAPPAEPVIGADAFGLVEALPQAWRTWARGPASSPVTLPGAAAASTPSSPTPRCAPWRRAACPRAV